MATPTRIGIIGAGPAGLAALKAILDSPEYALGQWAPTAFEASHIVGGVWHPSVSSPLYDSLTTNLPHPIMAFRSFPFPAETPLFPHAGKVQEYLEAYADAFGLRSHVRLQTRVTSVDWQDRCWHIRVDNSSEVYTCSLLLVCNGHHNTPRVPSIPGLDSWLSSSQPRAFHSQSYRNPRSISIPLKDASILVVGGGPSGLDISAELLPLAKRVFLSTSTGTQPSPPSKCIIKPRSTLFSSSSTVHFSDHTTEEIDYCILATGYSVTFPFFDNHSGADFQISSSLIPSIPPKLPTHLLTNTSYSLFPLARHIFGVPGCGFSNEASDNNDLPPPTSIAFPGLLVRVAPLPVVEAQARAALAAFRSFSLHTTGSNTVSDHAASRNTSLQPHPQMDWTRESDLLTARHAYLTSKFHASQTPSESAPSSSRQMSPFKDTTTTDLHESGQTSETPPESSSHETDLPLSQFISHEWHRFEPPEQFAYRDELDDLVFSLSDPGNTPRIRTREWELPIYAQALSLRRAWRLIEARGEDQEWVRGVGSGESGKSGEDEWVDLMWRVVKWGEEHDDDGEKKREIPEAG